MGSPPPPGVTRAVFSRSSLLRIVLDLLGDELAHSRGRSASSLGLPGWNETTRLSDDGLDLDSLELLSASAALNAYFHLHEYGAEDYLLALPTIGDWCDLVSRSVEATGVRLTFRTSGSTGTPKHCTHQVADLRREVDVWADLLSSTRQIVSLVPAHHIFGTIFTALLPDRLGVNCLSARFGGAQAVSHAASGTLVVGTPTMWAYLARSLPVFPAGVTGVTSTAPMPPELARQLHEQGLERLVEIYGSSETGGVGHRTHPASAFTLLDHWRRETNSELSRRPAGPDPARNSLMDEVEWLDERRFVLRGRRDDAVQIGGTNVFPEQVRQTLLKHPDVADAAVRFEPGTGRLKAFVVPAVDLHGGDLAARLDAWGREVLTAPERPRRIAVGTRLPRNALGKLTDW